MGLLKGGLVAEKDTHRMCFVSREIVVVHIWRCGSCRRPLGMRFVWPPGYQGEIKCPHCNAMNYGEVQLPT